GRIILGFEKTLERFTAWIQGLLKWALAHRAITIIGAVLLFFASVALVSKGFIGSEFVAQGDRSEFIVMLEYPKKTSVEQNNIITKKIEEYIAAKPEVVSLFTSVGQTSESGMGS